MARVRADDYDDKKSKILDAAARLFADQGYAGSRMEEIAKVCGVSKSMLYHYFKKKEDVLFEILQEHLLQLMEAVKQHIAHGNRTDKFEYFRGFVEVYLNPSSQSRARHVVALHDARYLTPEQTQEQVKLEREALGLIVSILQELKTGRTRSEYRVSAFLLVGMLNWVELWYSGSGEIPPNVFYQRITELFLTGFMENDGGVTTQKLSDLKDRNLVTTKRKLRSRRSFRQ